MVIHSGSPISNVCHSCRYVLSPSDSLRRIVRTALAYEEDASPSKLNLSLQGFRDDEERLFIPPTVRYVEKHMVNENILTREALPVEGHAPFLDLGVKFAYGVDSTAYRDRRVSVGIIT